jgi:hypothetical protein
MPIETTRVTVDLPDDVVAELRAIATANSSTLTDAISQSIRINKFLTDQEGHNAKILIETSDGKFQRVLRK